jgi:bifunctional pyridoxal-dependent enzyme with beta-cystathionase and maltose regulon repressor activities
MSKSPGDKQRAGREFQPAQGEQAFPAINMVSVRKAYLAWLQRRGLRAEEMTTFHQYATRRKSKK